MEQGQKFKQIRKQRKYTIQRLAQVAGSVASLSDFENNKTSLSNDTLFKLLKHLKVEYNEFFEQEYLVDETYIKLANQFNQASNHLDFEALELGYCFSNFQMGQGWHEDPSGKNRQARPSPFST